MLLVKNIVMRVFSFVLSSLEKVRLCPFVVLQVKVLRRFLPFLYILLQYLVPSRCDHSLCLQLFCKKKKETIFVCLMFLKGGFLDALIRFLLMVKF